MEEQYECDLCHVNFVPEQDEASGQLMQFNGIFYNLCGNCFAEFDGILQLEPKDQETVFELAKHLDKYKDAVDIVEYLRAKKALGEDRVQ